MANIELSKSTNAPATRTHDLFEAMRDDMNRVLERFEGGWSRWPSLFARGTGDMTIVPHLDVREDDKTVTVEAELPGVTDKDISITLSNGLLRIKGEKKHEREEKKDNYYLAERSFGSFERSLRLPDTIDEAKLDARFEQGVLKITAPKRPEAIKAEKKIEIRKA
jgi:HSP20 family protein